MGRVSTDHWEVKPRWVLGENVPGLLSSESGRFFGKILRDLASMGYRVGWGSVRASWVGAVHRRERIFIIAYLNGGGVKGNIKKAIQRISASPLQQGGRADQNWVKLSNVFEPKLWRSSDGISGWLDRLKCLGNAVVPQQVYPILKAMAEIEVIIE
jgi:DNA (cytosine-5)-methyltransferase 1